MKKLIAFIIFFLIIVLGIVYFTYGKEILTMLDEKKIYNVENVKTTSLDTLEEFVFFHEGILTYNNQKIVYLDNNNKLVWENIDSEFSKQIIVLESYIFRNNGNKIQVIDKNNQEFIIAEIQGEIVNVSRENDKTYIIIRNNSGKNALYILDQNNNLIVENKVFEENIIGVSISDKSEGYSLTTLKFNGKEIINNIYFNLLDDVELWNTEISGEILVKTKILNNNILAIGTRNIYYYNTNGKLMWKNGIYNKILDIEIDKENQIFYILFNKDGSTEIIAYNFEGKVVHINNMPNGAEKLKVYQGRIFVYNENSIYLIHGSKLDKIYEDLENNITDFTVEGNDIRILSKEKLILGQIK